MRAHSDIICVLVLRRMKLMVVSRRFLISSVLILVYMAAWRFFFSDRIAVGTLVACGAAAFYLILYREDVHTLLAMVRSGVKKDK